MSHNGGRALWLAVTACLFAILFFGWSLIVRIHDQERIDRVATTTHEALCTFKEELQRRADDTQVYIIELQHGVRRPIPGITVADLTRSLAGQRSTLSSLTDLDCG